MDMVNTSDSTRKKPCGKGRRKVEIKKIESSSRRMVAFSKRKKGLFNKAGELHRLCAVSIAVIIFSSTGRPFTFGKPSVDDVIDRLLRDGIAGDEKEIASCSEGIKDGTEEEEEEESRDMMQTGDSENENEDDDEDDEEKEEEEEKGGGGYWWEESIEGLSLEETEKFKASLEAIRNNVAMRLEEIMMRRNCERNLLSSIGL